MQPCPAKSLTAIYAITESYMEMPGIVAHACSTSYLAAEGRRSQVQGECGSQGEFKASLGNIVCVVLSQILGERRCRGQKWALSSTLDPKDC